MTQEQKEICKKIKADIRRKGVMIMHVANALGLTTPRLSAILSGKEKYVSDELLNKLAKYVDLINTDRISVQNE